MPQADSTRTTIALLTVGLLAASCSSSAETLDAAATSSTAPVPESTVASAPTEPEPSEVSLVLAEPDWSQLEERHLPAIGGLTFGVRPEYVVHHDNNMVTIRPSWDPDSGRRMPIMVVALVQNIFDAPFSGIEEFTDLPGFGTAEPTGESLDLFNLTLDGWSFTENEGSSDAPTFVYSAYGHRYEGPTAWTPFPLSTLYLAEVPGGVVAVGYVATDEADLEVAKEVFDTVAPTLTLDTPLDQMSAEKVEGVIAANYGPPPEPLELSDGPPILTQAFAPVDAGTYRSANLGTPMTVTIGDGWWVQPNFPGHVVLTGADSFGPGDRGLVFVTNTAELAPATTGPVVTGPSIDFTATDRMIADPPTNLLFTNAEQVDLNGTPATRFDITIDPSASCTADDPCHYLWPAPSAYAPYELQTGYSTRIWQINGLDTPITIMAQSPEPTWLDTAEEVVATVTFG